MAGQVEVILRLLGVLQLDRNSPEGKQSKSEESRGLVKKFERAC